MPVMIYVREQYTMANNAVVCEDIIFSDILDAASCLKLTPAQIKYRIKSKQTKWAYWYEIKNPLAPSEMTVGTHGCGTGPVKCQIGSRYFDSFEQASRKLGLSARVIRYRCHSDSIKWLGWDVVL